MAVCTSVLRSVAEILPDPALAELQVHSFNWSPPIDPPRLFIDHGSFADASFWAYVAPRLGSSDTIVVSSTACVRVAERFFMGEGPLIQNVLYSVDTDLFHPSADRPALRATLGRELSIPTEGPWLLVAAAFVRRKNHHLALLFLKEILETNSGARLLVVGATPDRPTSRAYRATVEALAVSLGVESTFWGRSPIIGWPP